MDNKALHKEKRMIVDVYTKVVLTVIAIALTVIALNPWIAPTVVQASYHLESIVSAIQEDVSGIAAGMCFNDKIC